MSLASGGDMVTNKDKAEAQRPSEMREQVGVRQALTSIHVE